MNSTNKTREFAPATKQEIEAWNYRVALEKQVKKKNKKPKMLKLKEK